MTRSAFIVSGKTIVGDDITVNVKSRVVQLRGRAAGRYHAACLYSSADGATGGYLEMRRFGYYIPAHMVHAIHTAELQRDRGARRR